MTTAVNKSLFSNFDDVLPFISTAAAVLGAIVVSGNLVGALMFAPTASGIVGPMRVKGLITGQTKDTTNPWALGQALYWDAANTRFTTAVTPARAGFAASAQVAADTTGDVVLWPSAAGLGRYVMSAAATLTNPSAETLFPAPGQYSIPANSLQLGLALAIRGWGQVTGQNSTNTHRFRGRLGGVAGLLLFDTGAVNAPAGMPFMFETLIAIRGVGATAGISIQSKWAFGTAGSGTVVIDTPLITTIDTTAAQVVGVTGLCSASSAGNTSRLDGLIFGQ